MKQLSELLREAKVNAPPPRYSVNDVVAAGQRRQRRQNTGWAIAAVVAVATAIGVPQIAAGRGGRGSEPSPVSSTARSPISFQRTVQQFRVGGYLIQASTEMSPVAEEAFIHPADSPGYDDRIGMLKVWRPGLFDPGSLRSGADLTVRGRPARYVTEVTAHGDPITGSPHLAWQYGDDAWAMVALAQSAYESRADLVRIAEGFVPASRPLTTPLGGLRVPDGYWLVEAGGPAGPVRPPTGYSWRMQFGPRGELADLARAPEPVTSGTGSPLHWIDVALIPPAAGDSDPPGSATRCDQTSLVVCRRSLPGGYRLTVSTAGAGLGRAEVAELTDALSVADPDDPASWYRVDDVVPASARTPLR